MLRPRVGEEFRKVGYLSRLAVVFVDKAVRKHSGDRVEISRIE